MGFSLRHFKWLRFFVLAPREKRSAKSELEIITLLLASLTILFRTTLFCAPRSVPFAGVTLHPALEDKRRFSFDNGDNCPAQQFEGPKVAAIDSTDSTCSDERDSVNKGSKMNQRPNLNSARRGGH